MTKKRISFLVTALALVCLFAFAVSAKDVYVKSGATGTGESASDPIGLISQATAAIGDEGGTVYVIGEYAVSANFTVPEVSGDVTFKGLNGGSLTLSANVYGTVNTNDNVITFDLPVTVATADDRYIIGRYNSITFGENFAVTSKSTGMLNFFGGVSAATSEEGVFEAFTDLPYDIVVNAGTFNTFAGGNFRGSISAMYGSISAPISITVNGGTFGVAGNYDNDSNNKAYHTFSVSGMSILADDATLTINGGTFNYPIYVQGRTGTIPATAAEFSLQNHLTSDYYAIDGDIDVIITGGTFNGGMVGAYYTQAAYTQLLRGDYNVTVTGGTFANGTKFDATQVKAYEGSDNKATITYSGVSNITPVRFDVVNGEAKTYEEPIRVVFIGDSITEGYAPTAADVDRLTESYPAAFLKYCEENGKDVIVGNYGVSASGFLPSNSRFYGNLVTWKMVSEETEPDFVFFAMGTNDSGGVGGTNGALLKFEERFEYFITTMGEIPTVDNVFITNAIFRSTSNALADHRTSAIMRPTQERIATALAAKDDKYVFVDLFGLTLDKALSDELFKDDNGKVNERLHPARAGLDFMGFCCYNAAFGGVYAPANYRLTDIYVSDSGRTYGAGTATDPIKNIGYAFDLMKRNADVTLHIVGTSTWVGESGGGNAFISAAPSKLTIVGEGNDAVIVTPLANTFKVGTDIKIDNVTLKSGTSAVSIIGCFNNVEITDTVKTDGTWSFYAGYNVFAKADPATTATFDSEASASSDNDCTVTVNGGNYATFVFGNGRFASNAPFGTYSGTLTATVGEGVTMNGAYVGVNGHNYLTGTINATLNAWEGDVREYAAHGSLGGGIVYNFGNNTGDVNITFAEGMTNNICKALDFDGSGEYDFVDFMMAVKYVVDGFDANKAANFYGDSVDTLLELLVLAKQLVK